MKFRVTKEFKRVCKAVDSTIRWSGHKQRKEQIAKFNFSQGKFTVQMREKDADCEYLQLSVSLEDFSECPNIDDWWFYTPDNEFFEPLTKVKDGSYVEIEITREKISLKIIGDIEYSYAVVTRIDENATKMLRCNGEYVVIDDIVDELVSGKKIIDYGQTIDPLEIRLNDKGLEVAMIGWRGGLGFFASNINSNSNFKIGIPHHATFPLMELLDKKDKVKIRERKIENEMLLEFFIDDSISFLYKTNHFAGGEEELWLSGYLCFDIKIPNSVKFTLTRENLKKMKEIVAFTKKIAKDKKYKNKRYIYEFSLENGTIKYTPILTEVGSLKEKSEGNLELSSNVIVNMQNVTKTSAFAFGGEVLNLLAEVYRKQDKIEITLVDRNTHMLVRGYLKDNVRIGSILMGVHRRKQDQK